MKPIAIAGMALLALAGCTTTETNPLPGMEPNLKEAARLNMHLGVDYMRKGELEIALEKLKRAIEQDPDLAPAHSSIAFVYARKGDNERAEAHYREALDLNSEDPSTMNNFGVFLCGMGELKEAEKLFLEAARTSDYPTPEAAWTNAGVCARKKPDLDKAETYFREALAVNPQFPDALAQMAWITYQKKDYLRARAFLQRYESGSKPTAETLWVGARTERALGDRVAALSYERRLKTQFPESPETYDLMRQSGRP